MRSSLRRESRFSCQVWGRVGAGEGDSVAETEQEAGSHQQQERAKGEQTCLSRVAGLIWIARGWEVREAVRRDVKLIDLPLNQSSSWRCFCPSRQLFPLKLSWSFLEIPHRILWVYVTHFWRTLSAVVVPWVFWFMHSRCMGGLDPLITVCPQSLPKAWGRETGASDWGMKIIVSCCF